MIGHMRTWLFLMAGMAAPAQASPAMINAAEAPPLAAWAEFCRKSPAECAFNRAESETIASTPENLELATVREAVDLSEALARRLAVA